MPLPTVAIVGRPNVGKSTLFNRLVGKRLALVDDRPGVTRDRREGEAKLLGLEFRVFDTAGFEDEDPHSLPGRMRAQTEAAVRDADAALFLIDARAGLRLGPVETHLDLYNLFDADWYDGEFVYASQFGDAASLVPVRHVTVGPPFTLLWSLTLFV